MKIRVLQGYENRYYLAMNEPECKNVKLYNNLTDARNEAKKYVDDYDLVYIVRCYDSYFRWQFIGYGIMKCFDWHKTLA